jgi:hypothetical protein
MTMLSDELTDRTCLDRFAERDSADNARRPSYQAACFSGRRRGSPLQEKCPLMDSPHLAPTSEFDRDLQRRVHAFLADRHYQALRRLQIEVKDGVVLLSGTLPTFHQRQVALDCARHVAGVLRVIDRLNVSNPST